MSEKRKSPFSKWSKVVARALFSFFMPGGFLFLAIAILLSLGLLDRVLPRLVLIYPYVVFVAGVLLGWRFVRSRVVFVILILALADRSLLHFAAGTEASMIMERMGYNAVSLLLPLNFVVFSLMKNWGILTWRGVRSLGLILLQGLGVYLVSRYQWLGFGPYLEHSFVDWPLLSRIPLSQPALFVFGLAFIFFIYRYIQTRRPIERAFFWALVSAFFPLVMNKIGPVSTFYFATAGLILVISMIESSYILAFHDEVTGLPTRWALRKTLSKVRRGYTMAMIDIDYFKKLNNRYGHTVGDQILRMVAAELTKITGGGKAFRYGSAEFIVIFPGKFLHETIPHLQGLKKAIKESDFILRSWDRPYKKPKKLKEAGRTLKVLPISVSIGVAERSDRRMGPQEVIKAADESLYLVKKAGRNQL